MALLRRADFRPYPFDLNGTRLTFELDPVTTVVESEVWYSRKENTKNDPLVLNGNGLEVLSIFLDRDELTPDHYSIEGEELTIPNVPDHFILTVRTAIHPAANTTGCGLYYTQGMFTTQCEPEGFRKMTYYPDHPDVLSVFETKIIADAEKFPTLLSNGNPEVEIVAGGKKTVVWVDPFKKPSYLFALVAGDLSYIEDHYRTTPSGRDVTLRIFSTKENVESGQCDFAMTAIKDSMKWDEESFGREYDLDLFMVFVSPTFNMGAMENKGLNIFNPKLVLALPETSTDSDFASIRRVIGHEYFHNWSGDRVTCRSWFELSLKEGFTVYRDQQFSRDHRGLPKIIEDVGDMQSWQFSEDAGPLAHPIRLEEVTDPENFYTSTVYEKGAEVIRMMEVLLGKHAFHKATDLYFSRHDGQAVTCEDFVKAMEDASGVDLRQFRNWYSYAGTPVVEIMTKYHPRKKSLDITVAQSCPPTPGQPKKPPFVIPFVIGFVGKNGDMAVTEEGGSYDPKTGMLLITKAKQKFVFRGLTELPLLSLNRRFAPVRVKYSYRDGEVLGLAKNDPDQYGRWVATQALGKEVLLNLVEDVKEGRPLKLDPRLEDMFHSILANGELDKAFKAELLCLPSTGIIGNENEAAGIAIDPVAIHTARNFAKDELALRFTQEFGDLFDDNVSFDPPKFDKESIAKRSLSNIALGYVWASGYRNDARRQYWKATNMTDRYSALGLLTHNCDASTEKALADFYDRFQYYPNVVDKWFAIQARSDFPGVLERVKLLMKHPAFDWKNPNRVRALIGAFTANDVQFHDLSGKGYRFFADFIFAYDQINPGVVAWMIEALTNWKRYTPDRQRLMKNELLLLRAAGLSRGAKEKVEKALAE